MTIVYYDYYYYYHDYYYYHYYKSVPLSLLLLLSLLSKYSSESKLTYPFEYLKHYRTSWLVTVKDKLIHKEMINKFENWAYLGDMVAMYLH